MIRRIVRKVRRLIVNRAGRPVINNNSVAVTGLTTGVILGSGFEETVGSVTLNGLRVATTSWTDTQIGANWGDFPFRTFWASQPVNTTGTLVVRTNSGASHSAIIQVQAAPGDLYFQINSISSGGIFANDTTISIGMYCYLRILTGSITSITTGGRPQGATNGTTAKYAVWDGLEWSNTANVTIRA